MLKRLILPAMLLAAATMANAQQSTQPASATTPATKSTAPALTPQQKAALIKQNQQMAQSAQVIGQLIDQGKTGEVWDQGSEVMKKAVSRDAFVSGVQSQRKAAGTMQSRKLARISRSLSKGDQKLPAGYYINVAFATQFSSNKQPVRELVSFHLDADKVLRVSGYTLQQPAAAVSKAGTR